MAVSVVKILAVYLVRRLPQTRHYDTPVQLQKGGHILKPDTLPCRSPFSTHHQPIVLMLSISDTVCKTTAGARHGAAQSRVAPLSWIPLDPSLRRVVSQRTNIGCGGRMGRKVVLGDEKYDIIIITRQPPIQHENNAVARSKRNRTIGHMTL
jgi:hypothetical protein